MNALLPRADNGDGAGV